MKKIVVIHLSRMGDMLQSIPFLASLKKKFPDARISLLAYKPFFKIISSSPYIDKFINLIDSRYIRAFEDNNVDDETCSSLIKNNELLRLEYDLLFNLTHNISSARLAYYMNAKKKAGALLVDQELVVRDDWCKYFFSLSKKREENLFNIVNIYQGMAGSFATSVLEYYNDSFLRRGKEFLKSYLLFNEDKIIIAIHPGANLESKQWGKDNFVRLINLIKQSSPAVILLLGSQDEQEIGKYIESHIDSKIINCIGLTKIEDLPGILQDVDLLISSDSGLSHVAASVGVKTVTISFGALYFAETSPYGNGNIIITPDIDCYPCKMACKDLHCKNIIDAESVLNAVRVSLFEEGYVETENILAYITKLNHNSLMYYYPLNKNVSDNFIKGVLNHYLWSSFFAFPDSLDFFNSILNKYINYEQVDKILDYYIRFYKMWISKYNNTIKMIKNYLSLEDSLTKDDLQQSLNIFLKDFEEERLLSDESIFKYFHLYEMIDFPQADNIDILQIVLDKYTKLEKIASLFVNRLQSIKVS